MTAPSRENDLLYFILGAHVLGAMKHQFIDKHDSVLTRMLG
ncbi:MAG: cytochrome b561 [Cyclobacteriaceae bacterium]|jgi:cytochrome b561